MKEIILCEVCREAEKTRVSQGIYCCDTCIPPRLRMTGTINKVFLKGYGMVESSRLKGLDNRVILPDNKPGGGYYVGSKRNGKITDKEPDY